MSIFTPSYTVDQLTNQGDVTSDTLPVTSILYRVTIRCEAIQDQRDVCAISLIPCTHVQYLPRFNIELFSFRKLGHRQIEQIQTTNESY